MNPVINPNFTKFAARHAFATETFYERMDLVVNRKEERLYLNGKKGHHNRGPVTVINDSDNFSPYSVYVENRTHTPRGFNGIGQILQPEDIQNLSRFWEESGRDSYTMDAKLKKMETDLRTNKVPFHRAAQIALDAMKQQQHSDVAGAFVIGELAGGGLVASIELFGSLIDHNPINYPFCVIPALILGGGTAVAVSRYFLKAKPAIELARRNINRVLLQDLARDIELKRAMLAWHDRMIAEASRNPRLRDEFKVATGEEI